MKLKQINLKSMQFKKAPLYICTGLIVFSIAFADQIGFGLEALKQMASKASLQTTVDQMEAKVLADKLADAKKLAKERENAGGTRDENLQRDIIVKVDTMAAEQSAALQQANSNHNESKRFVDLETATIDLHLIKGQVKVAQENLEVYEKEVAVAKKQNELGQVTALQVLEKENALLNHKQEIINLEQQAYQKTLELERLVGEPLKGAITIEYQLMERALPEAFVTEYSSVVIARQLSVVKAQNALNEKQLTFDLTDVYYDPTDKEYKSIQYDLEVAKFELKTAQQTEEISLVSDYQQLVVLKKAYQLEKENVALHEQRLAEVKKKQKLGAATQLEVLNGEMQLRNKRMEATKALGAYVKAVLVFELK